MCLTYAYYFIGWLRRETGYGPADRSVDVLWIVSGALFLRSSGIHPNLLVSHERLLYMDHVRYVWSSVICGLSMESVWCVGRVFPLQGVHRFESPRLSDMSNRSFVSVITEIT
jgi:hypothetical protein